MCSNGMDRIIVPGCNLLWRMTQKKIEYDHRLSMRQVEHFL